MKQLFLGTAGIVAAYFGLTWFFFGSPHPCSILEAKQRPHLIQKARADSSEARKIAVQLISSMQPEEMQAGQIILANLDHQAQRVSIALQHQIALMTPAECAWQAITWKPK